MERKLAELPLPFSFNKLRFEARVRHELSELFAQPALNRPITVGVSSASSDPTGFESFLWRFVPNLPVGMKPDPAAKKTPTANNPLGSPCFQPPPHIPDHELLQRIGSGSYGEVCFMGLGSSRIHALFDRIGSLRQKKDSVSFHSAACLSFQTLAEAYHCVYG